MGKVTTAIVVVNRGDEIVAERGLVTDALVRSVALDEVLVDTGATTLCLPQSVVDQLGLHFAGEVAVSTATGIATARVYDDARITIMGRTGTFECIALPEGTEPLLGVIPLERLGLEPDLQRQTLRVLPDHGRRTYLLAPTPITY